MQNQFHLRHLSAALSFILVGLGGINTAQAEQSHYFGRWTISDDKPAFSAKGKFYKTFDVAPCGKDFCGVSVDDQQNCGPTLFRFLTAHANNDEIVGHGRWGDVKKKLIIDFVVPLKGEPDTLYIGLGSEDMDLSAREGSVPTFDGNYKHVGEAVCVVK